MSTLVTPEAPSSTTFSPAVPRAPARRTRRPRPSSERRPAGMALRSRPFQIFLAGSLISWVGDWMDLAALNWTALTMTGSALDLALINACRLVPAFALSLPAGVLADRHDRRRLLIALTAATMMLTFLVGGLVAAGSPFWLFAAAVAVRSVFAAMVPPVRHALLPSLVPPEALGGAVAGQTTIMNISRMIGPALAGLLMAALTPGWVFTINGLSFVAVIWTLIVVRPDAVSRPPRKGRVLADLAEVKQFLRESPDVRSLLVLAVVPMIFGFPYTTMMPLFARELLHLGPEGFGMLLAISAAGALCGSAWLAVGGGPRTAGRWLVGSIFGFGLALLMFVTAGSMFMAALAMFLVGLASQSYRTMSRITIQVQVPDHLRGRILSIALMDRGLIPLGAILMGAIAEVAGANSAGIAMGTGCLVVTLAVLAARPGIWRL